jgi:hypothetical protein
MKRLGLKSRCSSRRNNDNLLKDKLDYVVGLYAEGHSLTEVGNIIGHSRTCISKLLQQNGYKIRDCRYKVDEEFFDVIDTEHKAYILGFACSNGTVDTNGRFRIVIRESDSYILSEFTKAMKYSGPLLQECSMSCLCIYRKRLVEALINKGCTPNKSLMLRFPTTEQVPFHLLNHFLRGIWDGKGCVHETLQEMSLVNTKWFCEDVGSKVLKLLDIPYIIQPTQNHIISELCIRNRLQVLSFVSWLYRDPEPWPELTDREHHRIFPHFRAVTLSVLHRFLP